MKRNKSRLSVLLLILIPVIGLSLFWMYKDRILERLPAWENLIEDTDPVDAVLRFLGAEPKEVRELRKEELVLTDEGHTEYYFSTLPEEEKRCYREMLRGIRERREKFYITLSGDEQVNHVYKALLFDHPELYWVHNREHVYRTVYGDSDYCLFTPGYTYTDQEMRQIDASMEEAYRELCSLIPEGAGEYEKISRTYAYIIDRTDYVASEHDQSIAGVFWKNEAVCAGYAGAIQYLLERMGIECLYVEGNSEDSTEGHAWNIVNIEGNYYYIDATNGDQPDFLSGDAVSLEEHKTIIYDYLCPFPDEYELTYTADVDFSLPDCYAVDYNFYVMNGACFDTYDEQQVYDLCCLRIDNNAAVIRFKFSDRGAFEEAEKYWIDGDAASDVAQYYMQVHDIQRVEYHSGVLDSFMTIYYIF